MRYLAQLLPTTGLPTGTSNTLVRHYANDRNAMRMMHKHLAAAHFAAGQYRVSRWPVGTFDDVEIGVLYKLAPVYEIKRQD